MKTTYNILAFLILLLMISCHHKRYHLNGDWSFENYVLSFRDTLCLHPFNFRDYSQFKIIDDTLYIKPEVSNSNVIDDNLNFWYSYIIKSKSDSILKLIGINSPIIQVNDSGKYDDSYEIVFKKLYLKNHRKIAKIVFTSSECQGECPSLHIEMTRNRDVLFKGEFYTDIIGLYEGQIKSIDFQEIEMLFNYLDFGNIKPYYFAPVTCMQYYSLVVYTDDNKKFKTMVYGCKTAPVELNLLLNKLLRVYRDIKLIKSNKTEHIFESDEYEPWPVLRDKEKQMKK